jgi:hypothetical protein
LLLCLITTGACANPATTRDGANLLAAYTTTVKQRIQANAASRDQLADARRELIDWVNTTAAVTEESSRRESTVFKIAEDKTRSKLYDSIVAASQAGVRAAPTAMPVATPASTLAVAGTKARLERLAAAAKGLTQLGTSASLQEQLKFFTGWVGAVGSSVQDAQKERESHTTQGLLAVEKQRSEVEASLGAAIKSIK